MKKSELKEIADVLSNILEEHVTLIADISGQRGLFENDKPIWRKLDLIERILDILRIEYRYLDNRLSIEDFLQGTLEISGNILEFVEPKSRKSLGSGTKPIHFQPKLLLFLLYRHNRGHYNIYSTIDNFIKTIWESLEPLDFKKTTTGVTRCFTNTRFAANTLRKYGLLKYTEKEAYKTWILSLPGMIVASKLMENPDWTISKEDSDLYFELHPDIHAVFDDLKDYNSFVKRMTTLIKREKDIFEKHDKGSKKVYSLSKKYWAILNDNNMKRKDKKEKCEEVIKVIEEDPDVISFYQHFSKLVEIGDISSQK